MPPPTSLSVIRRPASCRAEGSWLRCPAQPAPAQQHLLGRRHWNPSTQGPAGRKLANTPGTTAGGGGGRAANRFVFVLLQDPPPCGLGSFVRQQPRAWFTEQAEMLPQVQEQREQSCFSCQGSSPYLCALPPTAGRGAWGDPPAHLPLSVPGSGP